MNHDEPVKKIFLSDDSLKKSKKRQKRKQNNDSNNSSNNSIIDEHDSLSTSDNDDADERPTRKNRVITQTKKWEVMQLYLDKNDQYRVLTEIDNNMKSPECVYMLQEINRKINGYKCQDIEKHLYNPDVFVDTEYVVKLLIQSKLECYYCKEYMHVLYAEVRNPKQWSIERIDNTYGHNKNNVEIACLHCNLTRKTMYHERFLFTKQLGNIVKLG
jgi:hypothetical protein